MANSVDPDQTPHFAKVYFSQILRVITVDFPNVDLEPVQKKNLRLEHDGPNHRRAIVRHQPFETDVEGTVVQSEARLIMPLRKEAK